MAEPTLNLKFTDLIRRASEYMGWGDKTTVELGTRKADSLTRVIRDAYNRFLSAIIPDEIRKQVGDGRHTWSFLNRVRSLNITPNATGVFTPFADDFAGYCTELWWDQGTDKRNIELVSVERLSQLLSTDPQTGTPTYFAIGTSEQPDPQTGSTRWQLFLWPIPTASLQLYFRAPTIPVALGTTAEIPIFDAIHADAIKCAVLAECDNQLRGRDGVWEVRFQRALQASILHDIQQAASERQSLWTKKASRRRSADYEYEDLCAHVAGDLGFGQTYHGLTHGELEEVDDVVNRGYMQFLTPPATQAGPPRLWSFLEPTRELTLIPEAYAVAGALASTTGPDTNGFYTVTSTLAAFFPEMLFATLTPATGTASIIVEYISSTQVKVQAALVGSVAFTVNSIGSTMPDDYVAMSERFLDARDDSYARRQIEVVGDGIVRSWHTTTISGNPAFISMRPVPTTTPAVDDRRQRFQAIPAPKPDGLYVYLYKSRIRPTRLSESNPVPLGGPEHAETILASCLAAAEARRLKANGALWGQFVSRLSASLSIDAIAQRPAVVGNMSGGITVRSLARGGRMLSKDGDGIQLPNA